MAQSNTASTVPSHRPIHLIAREIRAEWNKSKKGIYFGAKPYLDAMGTLSSINDNYGMDDAKSIITYFLANASTFRGDKAKELKAELKKIAGIK